MKELKKVVVRLLFATEIIVFSFFYIFGSSGLVAIGHLKAENNRMHAKVVIINREISELEEKIKRWHETSFFQEKNAREKLQMARPGEIVYFVTGQ